MQNKNIRSKKIFVEEILDRENHLNSNLCVFFVANTSCKNAPSSSLQIISLNDLFTKITNYSETLYINRKNCTKTCK